MIDKQLLAKSWGGGGGGGVGGMGGPPFLPPLFLPLWVHTISRVGGKRGLTVTDSGRRGLNYLFFYKSLCQMQRLHTVAEC